jgi:hypothetical protein
MLRPEHLISPSAAPGERRRRYSIPIFRAKCKQGFKGLITSSRLVGVQCHYWAGRHIPCLLQYGKCPCQDRTLRITTIYWASVIPLGYMRQGMVAITESMLMYAPELRPPSSTRGLYIDITKELDDVPRSKNILTVTGVAPDEKVLPKELDVARWLCQDLFAKSPLLTGQERKDS